MPDHSLEAPGIELLVDTGTVPSAVANSGAQMADASSNDRSEGEGGKSLKSNSIEGDDGEGKGRGRDGNLGSDREPIDQLYDNTPPPTQHPVVRRSTRSTRRPRNTSHNSQSEIERETLPPAQKQKAAPPKKAKFTVTTCQKLLNRDEGGGLCNKDLTPETEVGKYKRCKMHRDIEAKRQQVVRQLRADTAVTEGSGKKKRESGRKRKREGGRKPQASKVCATLCSQSMCIN